jgi:hypothetical protein
MHRTFTRASKVGENLGKDIQSIINLNKRSGEKKAQGIPEVPKWRKIYVQ